MGRDFALYDPDLKTQTNGTVIPSVSEDYPRILFIGDSYFEAYKTWPGTEFTYGFNMAHNGSEGIKNIEQTATLACNALEGRFAFWEMGNEPDLFIGDRRPGDWSEQDYVDEWLRKTHTVKKHLAQTCHRFVNADWIAPSFAGVDNLEPVETWADGLDKRHNIGMNSMHK